MHRPGHPRRLRLIGTLAVGIAAVTTALGTAQPGSAATTGQRPLQGAAARQSALYHFLKTGTSAPASPALTPAATPTVTPTAPTNTHQGDDGDLANTMAAYNAERTAPAGYLTGDAIGAAAQQAAQIPSTPGKWQQFTTPDGAWFAGAADGGVWRSYDQGAHWTPVTDNLPDMSTGALAVDPVNGSLWLGTGEANESQDSYQGDGVWVSANDGNSWKQVGGQADPIGPRTIFRIAFDRSGDAYVATNNGLFRWDASKNQWSEVLDPAGATDFPPYDQQVTDVAVVPGTHGRDVITAIGWHGPGNTAHNGFYESTNYGQSFSEVTPTGDIVASDIGRTTFAYSADGSKLYAVVQSPALEAAGDESVLQGIFVASGTRSSPASVA